MGHPSGKSGSAGPHGARRHGDERRVRTLCAGPGLVARVSWYPPGTAMPPHAHGGHQVSLLLAGTLQERTPRGEVRLATPALGMKPAGQSHANDYGPRGALIVCVEIDARHEALRPIAGGQAWHWRSRPSQALLAHSRALLADLVGGVDTDAEDRVWEWLSATADCGPAPRGTRPGWIDRACMRLREDSAPLGVISRDEGLHPVYFSRAFARWMGCTPTVFRLRARLAHALASLARGASPAEAALQAGFADQAHFTRVARGHSGLSPRQWRAIVA